jgi:Protein of unknown function (DUF1571)
MGRIFPMANPSGVAVIELVADAPARKDSDHHSPGPFRLTPIRRYSGERFMRPLFRRLNSLDHHHKANGMAVAIACFAVVFLQLECQPRPAGADTIRLVVNKATPVVIANTAPKTEASDAELTPQQLSEKTLKAKITLLEKGVEFLKGMPDYTAQFSKQELVGGVLLEEQTMQMKLQHSPFSVYLKWIDYDIGREVLYVEGVNDGKMLVHAGGWKKRLPAISMEPNSSLATAEARHPVTEAGLLNLAITIINYNKADLQRGNVKVCQQLADQSVGGRDCSCFSIEYNDRTASPDYRKSVVMIDKEWGVPLFVKNFGWPDDDQTLADAELDEATLTESYTYSDIKFRAGLTVADFDRASREYDFKRQ